VAFAAAAAIAVGVNIFNDVDAQLSSGFVMEMVVASRRNVPSFYIKVIWMIGCSFITISHHILGIRTKSSVGALHLIMLEIYLQWGNRSEILAGR
jgi:hypothetical protein